MDLKVEIRLRDDSRSLGRAIALVEEDPDISEADRTTFLRLKDELSCSKGRKRKYMQQWRFLARWLGKDFKKADKRDIKRLVHRIQTEYPDELHKKNRAKTRRDYKQVLKKLYTLLEGDEDGDPPKKVLFFRA